MTKRSPTARSYPVRVPRVPVGPLAPMVLGECSGWLAGLVMRGGGYGIIWDIVLGLIGAFIGGLATLVFLYVCFRTFTSKEHVADNYWGEGATTLEWTQTSPPAFHTYLEMPRIS